MMRRRRLRHAAVAGGLPSLVCFAAARSTSRPMELAASWTARDHLPTALDHGEILDRRYHQATGAKQPDDATVEARNPAGGHVLWSFDAGNALHDGLPQPSAMQVGEHEWLVTDAAGHRTVLDISTGKTKPADPHQIGWCAKDGETVGMVYPWSDG